MSNTVSFKRTLRFLPCLFILLSFCISAQAQFRKVYGDSTAATQVTGMSFITPSTGFVSFSNYAGFTTDSGHTYTRRDVVFSNTDYSGYSVNLSFGFTTHGVLAFTKDSLLLYGDYGFEPSILFSANGGQSWKLVFHKELDVTATDAGQSITDMEFPGNSNTGFAVTHEAVLKTTDRGQHWSTVLSVPDGSLKKLSFPAASAGYAIGGNKMYKTVSNGSTWSEVPLPVSGSGSNFNNVFFTTATNGYITDYEQQAVFRTINSGSTWTQMNNAGLIPVLANDIYFLNDSIGFYAPAYSYSVYKTLDYGKTWEPCRQDPAYQYLYYGLNTLYFYNNTTGWAGGLANYLAITTNAGGQTLPKAYFTIDTIGLSSSGEVKLVNESRKDYQYKWYRNDVLISTGYSTTYHHDVQESHDNIKLIVSNGVDADTAQQDIYFEVRPLPVVSDFYPKTGSTGTYVVISGSNFYDVTGVSFGGVPAASFTVLSQVQIVATVAAGATGNVTVRVINGTSGSLPGFMYSAPPSFPPPVVASFAPSSGPVGTTITITGNNFNTNTEGDLVYFGMAKAAVTSASATRLVCKVPVGASMQPVSVLNTQTHLSGASATPFGVTFADSSNLTPHSFDLGNYFNYPSDGSAPKGVSTSDIDGDGKPDLIASLTLNRRDSTIVYRSIGTGDSVQFDAGTGMPYVAVYNAATPTIGDLDGDGKPDFAGGTNWNYVLVSRNISTPGKPASEPALTVRTNGGSQQPVIADFDDDGRPDLAVPCYDEGAVSVVRNTSSPGHLSFASHIGLPSGGEVASVAVGDLDGDGKKDIVASNSTPATFSYFKNLSTKGNIVFSPKTDVATSGISVALHHTIFMNDVDGDGKLDVIVVNAGTFSVYRNVSANGTIAFEAPKAFSSSTYQLWQGSIMENLSGDARPDFAGGDFFDAAFHYSDNTSSPGNIGYHDLANFQDTYPRIGVIYSSACADFNCDGKQDIVCTGPDYSYIYVLKNVMGKALPFTTCANDVSGIASDITGDTYQWQQNKGTGFSNITDNSNFSGTGTATLSLSNIPASWSGYTYRCVAGDRKSTAYILHVNTTPLPHVTLSTKDTAMVCPGTKFTFTAKSTNAGSYPAFTWQKNGNNIGYNDYQFTIETLDSVSTLTTFFGLEDSDEIRVIIQGHDSCNNYKDDTSRAIRVSVIGGGYPAVKMTSSKSSICTGESVTFTAVTKNCGKHPSYQWLLRGITDLNVSDSVYTTTTLQPTDFVIVKVVPEPTSCNAGQFASDASNVQVNTSSPPTVAITTQFTTVCEGSPTTFNAQVSNAGASAVYQWMINGVNAGTNSSTFTTDSLHNNDKVSVAYSNAGSACITAGTVTSNALTMVVNTVTAHAGPNQTTCPASGVTIGEPAVAGNDYQWTLASGEPVSSQAGVLVQPGVTTTYILKVTNGLCSVRDTVTVTVSDFTANAGADQTICYGGGTTVGSVAVSGYIYSWSSLPAGFTSSAANPAVTPEVTTNYILKTSFGNCVKTDTTLVQIAPVQSLPLPDSLITICRGKDTSIGVNPQPGYVYNWTSDPAGQVSSATSNLVVTPDVPTLYTLTAINLSAGCKEKGTVRVVPSDCDASVSVYPNPGRNIIHVQLNSLSSQPIVLQVVGSNGSVLIQQSLMNLNTEVNVSALSSGLYQFVIRKDKTIISRQRVMIVK